MTTIRTIACTFFVLSCATFSWAGFSGTDVVLPSVGSGPGAASSQWDTTIWIHNPSSATAAVTFAFYARNQSHTTPAATYNDSIPPGDTRRYTEVMQTMLRIGISFSTPPGLPSSSELQTPPQAIIRASRDRQSFSPDVTRPYQECDQNRKSDDVTFLEHHFHSRWNNAPSRGEIFCTTVKGPSLGSEGP